MIFFCVVFLLFQEEQPKFTSQGAKYKKEVEESSKFPVGYFPPPDNPTTASSSSSKKTKNKRKGSLGSAANVCVPPPEVETFAKPQTATTAAPQVEEETAKKKTDENIDTKSSNRFASVVALVDWLFSLLCFLPEIKLKSRDV